MPRSHPEGRDWAVHRIANTTAPVVIDIGCGEGTYSDLARGWRADALWVGVEVWEPYVDEFELWRKYDVVAVKDVREFPFPRMPFVLLAGDVLEHMPRSDAIALLERAKTHAEAIMISVPVVEYPQHAHEDGNPFEAHLDQWTFGTMWEYLTDGVLEGWRGDVVGRFWWTPHENRDPDPVSGNRGQGSGVDVGAVVDHPELSDANSCG